MKKTAPNNVEKVAEPRAPSRDVVIVHGVTRDKKGLRVLRARNQSIEAGELRPVVEGQPITSDLVRLKPRPDTPLVCDVETAYSPGDNGTNDEGEGTAAARADSRRAHSGPAQVASESYRENWDAIWAKPITAPGSSELN